MRLFHSAFSALGLEVRRAASRGGSQPPPTLLADPFEALHLELGGGEAAFGCPLHQCVSYNGFGYGLNSWHPFVATLRAGARQQGMGYRGSPLEAYFDRWQPANAAEALIGCRGSDALRSLPSHAFLSPWVAVDPEQRIAAVEWIVRSENRRHGEPDLTVSDGYNQHGPVSPRKGALEFRRLLRCRKGLEARGWDRGRGDATVTILQRGDELRYLVLHGHHRAGAAGALGFDSIPARPGTPPGVAREDARHWPQVRRGIWTEADAVGYFDHLFDFDARAWAAERSLAPPEPS